MKNKNVTVLESGVFDKIKNELTFENQNSGKITSASNIISLDNYNEIDAEFILIKNDGVFVYLVNLNNQSIAIHSDVKLDEKDLPSEFKNAFLSKSIDDAEKIYVLGSIDLKDKYPVKTGFLQVIAVEAKDLDGKQSLYPLDSMNIIYNIYRDDSFKATQDEINRMDGLKITKMTQQEFLTLVDKTEAYANRSRAINTDFDNPEF